MTVVVLLLLLLAAAAPLLLLPLRRAVADPVLPVAGLAALLLALAAALAAEADPVHGWRLAAALVVGVLAATTSGSLVVRGVFRLMRRDFLPARTRPVPATSAASTASVASAASTDPAARAETTSVEERPDDDADRPESVLRGGAWIGYLERAAVASTLLAGWPEGIALVLAVKGVGRYAELRETNAPETFIIGTLASLLWAVAAAGTAHLLR